MIKEKITKMIRTYLTGKDSSYEFRKVENFEKPKMYKTNLYIHIPFCNNLCPYCPYNKIEYNANKKFIEPYLEALLDEIQLYSELYGKLEISSIYIGGGTPTLFINEFDKVFDKLNEKFEITGDICIETSPNNINNDILNKMKKYGITLISLGVQSFQDKWLDFIGRKYKSSIIEDKILMVNKFDFKSLNIDLMFALPGQTLKDIEYDLEKAIKNGVNQITTYPLFTFPYTAVGKYINIKRVKMPKLKIRRKQYNFIHNYLKDNGFSRISVWGFKKGDVPRYSSVTRDNYLGLGAGAGSHNKNGFYLNTFSVEAYIERCLNNEFPLALHMEFTEEMQKYFWLYWRFYDTYISKNSLYKVFDSKDKKLNKLLKLFPSVNFIVMLLLFMYT